MEDLKLIDNELVPVYETDKGERVVYGTELHAALEVKTAYKDWSVRRFNECDAIENTDFEAAQIYAPSGQTKKEHIIKLNIAKEMAMLERNEIGKRVRKYFIEIENRYKNSVVDLEQLDPQTRLMNLLVQSISKQELEQKRQAEQLKRLEEKAKKQGAAIETVRETFVKKDEDTAQWITSCLNRVAESPNFTYQYGNRYSAAKNESYERLSKKAGCRLDQKVRNAMERAKMRGCTRQQINAISKLSVIMADKRLQEIYTGVIKEMTLAYCVDSLEGGA